jgi:hypothetical protein
MEPTSYRITVRGKLSERFVSALGDLEAEPSGCETVLVGSLVDQAQLYGVIDRLRDLGVELLRLERA